MEARERILVALDVNDIGTLAGHAKELGPHVGGFKIGLEALLSIGLKPALNAIKGYGPATENVFVDAKIHDIPETMKKAVAAVIAHPQVKFVNVHASAGAKGMRAAAESKGKARLLAVTVLTSMNDDDALEVYGGDGVGFPRTFAGDRAHKFALMAAKAGCDGVVCSAREVRNLRLHALGESFCFVTPGIRPKWSAKDDQERVTTPSEAVQNGSTYLVIGRPILQAKAYGRTPVGAAHEIAEEIRQALR